MPKQPDLSMSLRKAAGSRVVSPAVGPQTGSSVAVPPSRAGTVLMTLHVLYGEAFNTLFAREGQPEIAPATPRRGNGAMVQWLQPVMPPWHDRGHGIMRD